MKVVVGIDLGSTTTKAVLLNEAGEILGRGITNSRSNYEVACAVAREEALTDARFSLLSAALQEQAEASEVALKMDVASLRGAFQLELYVEELGALRRRIFELLPLQPEDIRGLLTGAVTTIMDRMADEAPDLFLKAEERKSDFFRDLAGAAYTAGAEALSAADGVPFERVLSLYDRAILDVETEVRARDFITLLLSSVERVLDPEISGPLRAELLAVVKAVGQTPIEEVAFVGTGYGRQTLPFPKEAVRSEILCHGRGAHRVFPGTRTVLDIGGQDTKAIQVNDQGVVTSFQMNDRCAAGCGRYLGYVADELNLGLHELGPMALKSCKATKVNSTCTVFAGAELRERLALGENREDILAGLHRAIMLRAMSLLARSGGVRDEFTFTGGVCKNPMATKVLRELVTENYGAEITLNAHPDSIYMGALGAAMFGLDDLRAGHPSTLMRPSAVAA
jgi:benzoyl-CoA reductase subunit A